jgi:hypothetical protein
MAVQAACQGGSFAVESVAAFAWNRWQASSGISGNLDLEYAHAYAGASGKTQQQSNYSYKSHTLTTF